jgi:hypothetical protein
MENGSEREIDNFELPFILFCNLNHIFFYSVILCFCVRPS